MEEPSFKYRDFVNHLNQGDFKFVRFCVEGYGHYRDCRIEVDLGDPRNPSVACIAFLLTPDGKERCYFHGPFNEGEKIFHLGKEGNLTLQLVWKRVKILELVWAR